MAKSRVLFLCVHNSARSQMAEAFLKKYSGSFEVMSAGLEAGTLNSYVVEAMKEKGIDISNNKTKSAFDLYKQGLLFSHVITVCDRQAAERCPVFPGVTARLHWPFDDPSKFTGSKDEIMAKTRIVRDEIESKVKAFIEVAGGGGEFEHDDLF
jgi:arsenate reductase (thioredoxin)